MTLSMIGGHFTKNGIGANYPSRVCLSIAGNGLGEQHPDTIVLFRDVTVYNDGPPDLHTHPQRRTIEFAQYWYDKLRPIWQANAHRAHYFTITNELGGSSPEHIKDHIAFEANICKLAHADGLKCAVGKLAGDSPDWNTNLWEELYAPFIVQMWNQYGAVYARHVYGGNLVDGDGNPTQDAPGNPSRPFLEADYLRSHGYGGGMVIAECGLDAGYGVADYGRFQQQILGYEAALKPYADVVIGFCIWECGASGFEADYTAYLQQVRPYLDLSFPKWEGREGNMTAPRDCDLYMDLGRFVHLLPQDTSSDEIATIAVNFNAGRNSFVYSHDDAELIIAHGRGQNSEGKKVSEVKIWEPQRFTFDVTGYFASKGYKYSVGYFSGQPPAQWTKLPIPHMSQLGTGASARSNDCGAACVAMVVNGMTSNRPTVDNVAIAYQNPANSYMSFAQVDTALNGYGMDGTHKRPYSPDQISATIAGGKPVIALVWYQSLPYKFSTFNGSHFIVVYGTDKNGRLVYRDPLATNSNELVITYAQLETAMRDAQNNGNQPNQGMDCVKKNETGQTVDTLRYFVPSGQYGRKIVMRVGSGTQPMQLEKRANDVILRKGDGLWIGGVRYQDSEQWKVVNGQVQKGIDTSDAGNGGRDAYDLNWAQWIPQHVEVGKTYHSTPTVRRFDRTTCMTISSNQASDYLYIKALVPKWTSLANSSIVLNDVLIIEWRSGTPDLNVPPTETYYFAKEIGYCGWGSHFINEIADGQAPLTGKLDCGM